MERTMAETERQRRQRARWGQFMLRVDKAMLAEAHELARSSGQDLTQVLRRAVTAYVHRERTRQRTEPAKVSSDSGTT